MKSSSRMIWIGEKGNGSERSSDRLLCPVLVPDLDDDQGGDDRIQGKCIPELPPERVEDPNCQQEQDHRLDDLFPGNGEEGDLAGLPRPVRAVIGKSSTGFPGGKAARCGGIGRGIHVHRCSFVGITVSFPTASKRAAPSADRSGRGFVRSASYLQEVFFGLAGMFSSSWQERASPLTPPPIRIAR
jgi:hypothetical protein